MYSNCSPRLFRSVGAREVARDPGAPRLARSAAAPGCRARRRRGAASRRRRGAAAGSLHAADPAAVCQA